MSFLKWMKFALTVLLLLIMIACGGGGSANGDNVGGGTDSSGGSSSGSSGVATGGEDEFNSTSYRGLTFYHKNMPSSAYTLNQLSDEEFNALSDANKLLVADKLLSTLFFGYPLQELKTKMARATFLSDIRSKLEIETTDKVWLENYLLDSNAFNQYEYNAYWYIPQANQNLARFYAMKDLDRYFFNNWIAYILTQTIMFSPAYELTSVHISDITGVYSRLVAMLQHESGMRYITYVHMMSIDNWRRFRSPEDNGREMLEIYLRDNNDSHVPVAAKALQNWKLSTAGDTLVIGLNQNGSNLEMLTDFFGGEEVITGEDYFRELAKSSRFTSGVTRRLVDFFFAEKSESQKETITQTIVSSNPETWQDILLQIIFSEEYLLHNNRGQSGEETFFSLAKKMHYRHYTETFYRFRLGLENMHQATMKYKLGKLERVPQDTLSFAHYYNFIRDNMLFHYTTASSDNDPSSGYHEGWQSAFISFDKFAHDANDHVSTLRSFVDYLFESVVARKAKADEHALFKNHMIETRDGKEQFKSDFNIFAESEEASLDFRRQITMIVMDYLSQLDDIYRQSEVE